MSLLLTILASDILPIFAIAAIGFLLARRDDVNIKTLTTVVFNALSPCLVFYQLVTSTLRSADVGRMILFGLILMSAMGIVGRVAGMWLRLDRETLSSFLLVVMFSNSGNYALPVILFAFGREALSYAAVYFVTSAIAVYTIGVVIAARGKGSLRRAIAGIFRVPAVYALVAAAVIRYAGVPVPDVVMRPVRMLSDAAIPMMLIILGTQLQRAAISHKRTAVAVAAALSLVLSPFLGIGLCSLLGLTGAARQAAIVLSAMPAAVITTVIAIEFHLDPAFVTSVVFVTTILSPFTLVGLIAYLS